MATSLIDIVESLGQPRVLVLGDLILDRYVWGDAERISQEAPVILLRADRREERLGGAASVSCMLSALGAEVSLAGLVGEDDSARRCVELLDDHNIERGLVLRDASRPTTLKERYIGRAQHKHPQQMLRVDYETREMIGNDLLDQLAAGVESRLIDYDIVLISDYDKGVCAPELVRRVIESCRDQRIKVLVDPIRGGNYAARYRGCSAMTPNRLEAGLATDRSIDSIATAFEAADQLRHELHMEVGLVTMDKEGIILVDRRGESRHFPVRERQVYDITGAGDMVLAVLGMVLAAGHDYPEAIALANVAGGLEVERIGVATLTREELIHDILHASSGSAPKILSREQLVRELDTRRRGRQSIVFTNGCFDILHAGHVRYLRDARQQGDVLVVGLNSDGSVRRLNKGPGRPINDLASRAAVLAALDCVDYVCSFDDDTPLELIEAVRPDVLVKGADYRPDQVVGKDFVEANGGRLYLAQLVPDVSTTRTLERLKAA